jgi:hypothetical protein
MVTAKNVSQKSLLLLQLCSIISKGKGSPSAPLLEMDRSSTVREQQTFVKTEKGNIKQ